MFSVGLFISNVGQMFSVGLSDVSNSGQTFPIGISISDAGQMFPVGLSISDAGQMFPIGLSDVPNTGQRVSKDLSDVSNDDQTFPISLSISDAGQKPSMFPIVLLDHSNAGQIFPEYSYTSQKGALCLYKLCSIDVLLGRGVLLFPNSRALIF